MIRALTAALLCLVTLVGLESSSVPARAKHGMVVSQETRASAIGADVLRHRVLVTYEAEAEEKTAENIIRQIFNEVEVP